MASLSEYSELFFLDEATALSAGHRPCGACRKADYQAFKSAWCRSKGIAETAFDRNAVDREMHKDRCDERHHVKQTCMLKPTELPNGAMFLFDERPHLRWKEKFWLWSAKGYTQVDKKLAAQSLLEVLTPKIILEVLRAGYPVQVHRSAAFA